MISAKMAAQAIVQIATRRNDLRPVVPRGKPATATRIAGTSVKVKSFVWRDKLKRMPDKAARSVALRLRASAVASESIARLIAGSPIMTAEDNCTKKGVVARSIVAANAPNELLSRRTE